MKKLALILTVAGTPAIAASGPFSSLYNTNYVVIMAFLLYVGVIIYLKVPGLLMGLLDARADGIRDELNQAKALREEAQTILASYERKQREVQAQADRIVEHAKTEAEAAAKQALEDLKASIVRRLAAAQDQIASAEASAVKEVRDTAIQVAISAASDVIAANLTADDRNALIEDSIVTVGSKLH
ncbi:MAG: F0F1 ATP synthase subunit B [Paracoccaceae bacterium]